MKNFAMILLVMASFISSSPAQSQICCDPCPEECCWTTCAANGQSSVQVSSVESGMDSEDISPAEVNRTGSLAAFPSCSSGRKAEICQNTFTSSLSLLSTKTLSVSRSPVDEVTLAIRKPPVEATSSL
jgi:hypothetical protein